MSGPTTNPTVPLRLPSKGSGSWARKRPPSSVNPRAATASRVTPTRSTFLPSPATPSRGRASRSARRSRSSIPTSPATRSSRSIAAPGASGGRAGAAGRVGAVEWRGSAVAALDRAAHRRGACDLRRRHRRARDRRRPRGVGAAHREHAPLSGRGLRLGRSRFRRGPERPRGPSRRAVGGRARRRGSRVRRSARPAPAPHAACAARSPDGRRGRACGRAGCRGAERSPVRSGVPRRPRPS